jgi:tetratricopeptide (TPR) repeat protein
MMFAMTATVRCIRQWGGVFLIGLALTGCNFMNQTVVVSAADIPKDIHDKIPEVRGQSGAAFELSQGISNLLEGKLDPAFIAFNRGLKYDPRHPHLHFLNALIYHLRANAGDTTQYELAEVGYKLALKFDSNHWLAAYQLGKLQLAQHRYQEARDSFSRALRIEPGNSSVAFGLAAASYAAGQPETAQVALSRLSEAYRNRPQVLRANALTAAALGDMAASRRYVEGYRRAGADIWRVRQIERRLNGWETYHRARDGALAQNTPYMGLPLDRPPVISPEPMPPEPPPAMPALPVTPEGPAPEPVGNAADPRKMVILDAMIINREKSQTSQTGVNLLSGLSLMFSGNLLDYARNRTDDFRDDTSSTSTRQANNSLTIALPAVTYSLNIANAQDSNNHLLARPSVLAYDRTESEIFVGTELTYTTSGDNGGSSYNKEVGLKLRALPEFLPDGLLKITVDTEFDAFAPTAAPGTFSEAVATVKTRSHVVAEVNFGQTLVIGAGSSKRKSSESNGVPVLKDIPLLGNLFNVEGSSDQETAVLILITPRRPAHVDEKTGKLMGLSGMTEGNAGAADTSPELDALRRRYGMWWQPTSNMLKAMHGLLDADVVNEFRRGDIQFLDLDAGLSLEGSPEKPGPGGLVRTLVESVYY